MKTISNQSIAPISVSVRSILPDGIFLAVHGKDYYLSYNRLPWFRDARISDIFNVSMMGDDAVRWETLDVDLEIESLKHPEKYPLVMKRSLNEVL
jgi:ribosomal protein S1